MFLTAPALGRGSGMDPAVLTPNPGGASGTAQGAVGHITPGLTRDTGLGTCLCQCSSRSAEIPSSHGMERDPGAAAKENGAEQAGQRAGGKRCPRLCPEQGRARPSLGSPQPSCASRSPPSP